MQLGEVASGGLAERGGAGEYRLHGGEVIAGGGLVGVDQADDDGGYDVEDADLVSRLGQLSCSVSGRMDYSILLDGLEEGRQLELGEHNGLVAAE